MLQLWHQALYFGTILPNAFTVKTIKNYVHRSCPALAPNILMKLTSGLIIMGQARSFPYRAVLSYKYYVRLERLAREKRSSLFGPFVSDKKGFITFATRGGC
jgi:hypothetical protein